MRQGKSGRSNGAAAWAAVVAWFVAGIPVALGQAPPVVELVAVDNDTGEAWPEAGAFVVRRLGTNGAPVASGVLAVNMERDPASTAVLNTDYSLVGVTRFDAAGKVFTNSTPSWFSSTKVTLHDGVAEAVFEVRPKTDTNAEPRSETVRMRLLANAAYAIAPDKGADTVTIWDAAVPSREAAVRFLCQASFGPGTCKYNNTPTNEIDLVQNLGYAGWVDWQLNLATPPVLHGPMATSYYNLFYPGGTNYFNTDYHQIGWWTAAMGYKSPETNANYNAILRNDYDPLRQRIAWALSQIFVVSEIGSSLGLEARGLLHWYDDVLLGTAHGNYRQTLERVTYHPVMGHYLSHLRNRSATTNELGEVLTRPDENFAREILQLFSIGVYKLERNGTPVVDANGRLVETYSNDQITEFARVFTGLTLHNAAAFTSTAKGGYTNYMKAVDVEVLYGKTNYYHDFGPKTLLQESAWNTRSIPASTPGPNGAAARADIAVALDNVATHPNVGPYLGRILIQRLTASNPSTAYIDHVASAFNDSNGAASGGVRGDWRAVARAILLDPEARNWWQGTREHWGALREPLLRAAHLCKVFRARPGADGYFFPKDYLYRFGQEMLRAPSVFNFYQPDFMPPDEEALNYDYTGDGQPDGLFGPEFQISTDVFMMQTLNTLAANLSDGLGAFPDRRLGYLDFSNELALAGNPDALVRHLDLHLCAGKLGHTERKIITDSLRYLPASAIVGNTPADKEASLKRVRVTLAVSMFLFTPEFNVLR